MPARQGSRMPFGRLQGPATVLGKEAAEAFRQPPATESDSKA